MAHISKIGFSNYRVFDKLTEFDLSRINILTGTNGSGKSTMIKGLLLFFDSLKKNGNFDKLDLRTSKNDYGGFEKLKPFLSEKPTVCYRIDIQLNLNKDFYNSQLDSFFGSSKINLRFEFSEMGNLNLCQVSENELNELMSFSSFNEGTTSNENNSILSVNLYNWWDKILKLSYYNKNSLIFKLWYENFDPTKLIGLQNGIFKGTIDIKNTAVNKNYLSGLLDFSIIKDESDLQRFVLENIGTVYFHSEDRYAGDGLISEYQPYNKFSDALIAFFDIFSNDTEESERKIRQDIYFTSWNEIGINRLFQNKEGFIDEFIKNELTQCFRIVENLLDSVFKVLSSFKFNYIASFRGIPQRIYLFKSNDTIIHKFINEVYLCDLSNKQKDFLNFWLKEFGIAEELQIELVDNIGAVVNFIVKGKKVNIVDMGFGITQVFPLILGVILNCHFAEEWSKNPNLDFLMIEEPETNLHPALQSKMGDFFIDAIKKFNVNLIIETHSEYIIRKLQHQVAQKSILPTDVNIYYFNSQKNIKESKDIELVKQIRIQENGFLDSEFGPGFFDVADDLYLDLFSVNNDNNEI